MPANVPSFFRIRPIPPRPHLMSLQEVEYVKEEAKLVYLLECLQKTAPPVLVFAGAPRRWPLASALPTQLCACHRWLLRACLLQPSTILVHRTALDRLYCCREQEGRGQHPRVPAGQRRGGSGGAWLQGPGGARVGHPVVQSRYAKRAATAGRLTRLLPIPEPHFPLY